jgi:hypothetical protein
VKLIGICFFGVAGVWLAGVAIRGETRQNCPPAECLLGLSGLVGGRHQPRKALVSSRRAGQRATAAGNGRRAGLSSQSPQCRRIFSITAV